MYHGLYSPKILLFPWFGMMAGFLLSFIHYLAFRIFLRNEYFLFQTIFDFFVCNADDEFHWKHTGFLR